MLQTHLKELKKLEVGDKLVISDIDGTIFRDSLFLELYAYLKEIKLIPKYKILELDREFRQWKNRELDYETYLYSVVKVLFKAIKDKSSEPIIEGVCDRIRKLKKRVYLFTKNKIKEYKDQGYKVILLSGSPDFLAKEFGTVVEADICLGAEYHTLHGYFTGTLDSTHSTEKKEEIINYIKKVYQPSDLVTFGDTNGDFGLLTLGNKAFAINPSRELYEKIRHSSSITSIIERKNLILELKSDDTFKQILDYNID